MLEYKGMGSLWSTWHGSICVLAVRSFFIGGEFNTTSKRFERVYKDFEYGDKKWGEEIWNFDVAYDLMVVNIFFRKRQSYFVIFSSD
jgi:hypothetical protein